MSNWIDNIDDNGIGIPESSFIMDIAIHPDNSSLVAVVIGGYRDDQIWLTRDAGGTWIDISSDLPPVHLNSVVWHPRVQDFLYVGSDLGIYATGNQGENWNLDPLYFGNSDGPANTQISELFWQGNGTKNFPYYLCAATSGRGLWRSSHSFAEDYYVDKNYTGFERGTISQPFNTFREALNLANYGSTIHFLSGGVHEEIGGLNDIVIDKRINFSLLSGGDDVILK